MLRYWGMRASPRSGTGTCVGVMWLMSSEARCFRRVVLPPLSRPSSRIRTSWSGVLFSLRRMESNPCHRAGEREFRILVTMIRQLLMKLMQTLIPLPPSEVIIYRPCGSTSLTEFSSGEAPKNSTSRD